MRTTPDGRIIAGGRDEKFYNPLKRDKLIEQKAKELRKDFNYLFPGIEFKPQFNWTGTFGSKKDGLPFIGITSGCPTVIFHWALEVMELLSA